MNLVDIPGGIIPPWGNRDAIADPVRVQFLAAWGGDGEMRIAFQTRGDNPVDLNVQLDCPNCVARASAVIPAAGVGAWGSSFQPYLRETTELVLTAASDMYHR
jgi:hypothetical protein